MKQIGLVLCICIFYFAQYKGADLDNYRSEYIRVEIKGCVQSEGTYELSYGASLEELITMAQGFSEEADTSTINLNQTLTDKDVYVIAPIREAVLISINAGTLEELCEIKGVGEATAQRIIDYRNTNGSFSTLEDIMKVKGIKEASYAKMKDHICL